MEVVMGVVLVAALAIAFVAQSLLSPQRRTRIIFVAAAAAAIIPMMMALVFIGPDAGSTWFQTVLSLAFGLCVLLFAGVAGAIAGAELASLTNWLLRRRR